jgi:hypothetical protein
VSDAEAREVGPPRERFLVVAVPPEGSDLPTLVVEVEAADASSAAREVTGGEAPEGTTVYAALWEAVSSFIVLTRPRDAERGEPAAVTPPPEDDRPGPDRDAIP